MKTQVKTKFNLPKFEFQHEFERSRKLIYYQEGENKYNYKYTNTTTNTQIQLQIHKYNFQEADVLWGGGGQPVPDRAGRRLVHRHLEQHDQQLLSHWNLFGIKTHWRQLLVVCQIFENLSKSCHFLAQTSWWWWWWRILETSLTNIHCFTLFGMFREETKLFQPTKGKQILRRSVKKTVYCVTFPSRRISSSF